MLVQAKTIYILMIKVNKLLPFCRSQCFLRRTRKTAHTLVYGSCSHSISRFPKRSASFFHQIPRSANIFVQIQNHNHTWKQKCPETFKGKLLNVHTSVNFAQIVKLKLRKQFTWWQSTILSLTTEFKWASFEKKLIWMNSFTYRPRLKKDVWSKFLLGPKIQTSKQAQSEIRTKIYSCSTVFSKSVNLLDLPYKSVIRALFKAKSVDLKTCSSLSIN